MCPYCKAPTFQNSWGEGNAYCPDCDKEFNVVFKNGIPTGEPLPRHLRPKLDFSEIDPKAWSELIERLPTQAQVVTVTPCGDWTIVEG